MLKLDPWQQRQFEMFAAFWFWVGVMVVTGGLAGYALATSVCS